MLKFFFFIYSSNNTTEELLLFSKYMFAYCSMNRCTVDGIPPLVKVNEPRWSTISYELVNSFKITEIIRTKEKT